MKDDSEPVMTSGPREVPPASNPKATIKQSIVEFFEVPEDVISFDEFFEPTPNLYVFQAIMDDESWDRPKYAFGALAGDELGRVNLVADVWGYDHRRPVSAETVARVFGIVTSKFEPQWPLLKQTDIDSIRESLRDEMFLPRETTVEGLPAVQFWMRHPRKPYPALITAVFHPDRTVSFRSRLPDSVD